jgi:hypothetical protein
MDWAQVVDLTTSVTRRILCHLSFFQIQLLKIFDISTWNDEIHEAK